MNIIGEFIERWMNKRCDGEFTSNHKSGDEYCNDVQCFHDGSSKEQHLRLK